MDANGLYVAFCILLLTNITREIRQCPAIVQAYTERLLRSAAPFVQAMTVNCIFGLAIDLFETVPEILTLFDRIGQGVSPALIEKGLSLFMRRHFVLFAMGFRWRPVVRLLLFCIAAERELSLTVFRDLLARARDATLDFEQCWLPIVEVLVVLVRRGKTAYTADLQALLLTAKLSTTQWRDVFQYVLFPALSRGAPEVALFGMFTVVVNAFLYAVPVLDQSPLFESIWFRLLSGALELGRAHKGEGSEEIPELLAKALKVMSAAGAFRPQRQKMWELTKSNIEAMFPKVITGFLSAQDDGSSLTTKYREETLKVSEPEDATRRFG
jgi:hypothetical protein